MLPSQAVRRTATAPEGGSTPRARERGAVLVHVAVAMVGLCGFAALSIDLGTLWVARAQAQNAVDAAAHAGIVSLAYVSASPDTARAAAQAVIATHQIWGTPVSPGAVTTSVGTCPPGAPSTPGECVNVGVAVGTATGNALPVFFSRLFGVGSTDLWASASAKVMAGNAAPCVRPLALVDRWTERYPSAGTWTSDDAFQGWDASGTPILPAGTRDEYTPPSAAGTGTGFTVADQRGVRVVRTLANPMSGLPPTAGGLFALDLPRPGSEGDPDAVRYEANLTSCSGIPMSIGASALVFEPHRWFYTYRPMETLIAQDPGAVWDDGMQAVRNSAFSTSPRLLTVAVYDPYEYVSRPHDPSSTPTVVIRNLVGLFVERVDDTPTGVQITGVLMSAAGRFDGAAPIVDGNASFLRTVALVR